MLDPESADTIYAPAFVQLSKSPVIPMPVHGSAWDTEGYTATTSTDPMIGMRMTWLHCAAVIVHEFSSFFSTVTEPSFWVLLVTASCIYKTSHGDPLPDEKAKKHLCPPPLLKVTFALFVLIVIALVPASGARYTEC